METIELFQEAQDADIQVMWLDIPKNGSMCLQMGQRFYIGMDRGVRRDEADERVHLAHELGHCMTGAFYNRWAARDVRQKHEHRADKWAIQKMIPKESLNKAILHGHTDIWDLANVFNVTEDFMKKAVCWYTYGNLATEMYF